MTRIFTDTHNGFGQSHHELRGCPNRGFRASLYQWKRGEVHKDTHHPQKIFPITKRLVYKQQRNERNPPPMIWWILHPTHPSHDISHAPKIAIKMHYDRENISRCCIPENAHKVANIINMHSDHRKTCHSAPTTSIWHYTRTGRVYNHSKSRNKYKNDLLVDTSWNALEIQYRHSHSLLREYYLL